MKPHIQKWPPSVVCFLRAFLWCLIYYQGLMICEFKPLQVSVPKGSLCNLSVKVNIGLPPDTVYDIVTDPENKRVFKNIKVRYFITMLKDLDSSQSFQQKQYRKHQNLLPFISLIYSSSLKLYCHLLFTLLNMIWSFYYIRKYYQGRCWLMKVQGK